jgi:hypothetical protein
MVVRVIFGIPARAIASANLLNVQEPSLSLVLASRPMPSLQCLLNNWQNRLFGPEAREEFWLIES